MVGAEAREVRLYLIRHGETVDNVAGNYAGRRDSELTNHGYQQATRLGHHFQAQGVVFTHHFCSDLQRAATTAAQIRQAQVTSPNALNAATEAPAVVQTPLLVEKDFGVYEGTRCRAIDHPLGVETKESMSCRADAFLDRHLLPLFLDTVESRQHVIAVVSHGIMLSVLWKRLLLRLPPNSIRIDPDVLANVHGYSLEYIGPWANTGYLELHCQQLSTVDASVSVQPTTSVAPMAAIVSKVTTGVDRKSDKRDGVLLRDAMSACSSDPLRPPKVLQGWSFVVKAVNGKDHLKSLKRTRGGVGSARHDPSQKSLESFFKKQKVR
ncbi:phosphoglycerate mutase-like protein [Sporormia fimetaria CBS 119925]|uniref:Phosphoglycerate mutase-like protein n=1 Tax=Sporormia fimetaria CBS 119925 TaxID=1340428 RepID=A0A6A6VJ76_9PLEO|nr:phosphoglycerate mutase-like protein [Sporormia fimetaria CBS 119925]